MLNSRPAWPWRIEFHHMIHDLAGAFLFGVTFLFTMEVWWRGNTAQASRILLALALTYIALVALEHMAIARKNRPVPWFRAFTEAAQALAIGLVAAALGLLLIGDQWISNTIVLGLPASIGGAAGRLAA